MPGTISPITFPMLPNEPNDGVENLHRALLAMLERAYISWPEQSTAFAERFKHEVENLAYADATVALVKAFQEQASLEPTGAVDELTAGHINNLIGEWKLPDQPQPTGRYRVYGEVYAENRDVFPSIVIRAFDRDLRRSQQLGVDATPDADGRYQIEYDRDSFLRAEKRGAVFPNLFVQAFKRDENRNETQFDVDKTILNPTGDDRADFTLPAEPSALSEWERMTFAIEPLLEGQGERDLSNEYSNLHPSELNDTDLDFIAQETGLDREHCRLWALGFKAARSALPFDQPSEPPPSPFPKIDLTQTIGPVPLGFQPDIATLIPKQGGIRQDVGSIEPRLSMISPTPSSNLMTDGVSSIFYAWFSVHSAELNAIWLVPVDTLLTDLKTAIARRSIPARLGAMLDDPALRRWIVANQQDSILQSPAVGTSTSLSAILGITSLNKPQKRSLAGSIADLRPDDPDLVKQIMKLDGFGRVSAIRAAHALRLGALTNGHVGLMTALQSHLDEEDNEGTLRPLATLRPDAWFNLVHKYGTPNNVEIPSFAHAKVLWEYVEVRYPTAALTAHLSTGRRLARQTDLKAVGTFLKENPDFDLVSENLNNLAQKKSIGNTEITPDLVEGLRTLKRMNMGGVTWGETAVFMENGIRSLTQIADAGPGQLKELVGDQISPERLEEIHANIHNMRVNAFAAYSALMSPLSGPPIMKFPEVPNTIVPPLELPLPPNFERDQPTFDPNRFRIPFSERQPQRQDPPTLLKPELPPEMLELIKDEPMIQYLFGSQDNCACEHCQSVLSPAAYYVDLLQFVKNAGLLEVLLECRPDLVHIELSCENTNTVVPAIDLILETLENAVALAYTDPEFPRNADTDALLSSNPLPDTIRKALEKTAKSVSPSLSAAGTSPRWVVVDDHKRWELYAQNAAIEVSGTRGNETIHDNLTSLISELNQGIFPEETKPAFASIFYSKFNSRNVPSGDRGLGPEPPTFDNYVASLTSNPADGRWSIQVRFEVQVEIDFNNRTLGLYTPKDKSTPIDKAWWDDPRQINLSFLEKLQAELQQQQIGEELYSLIADRFPARKALRVIHYDSSSSRWIIATPEVTINLVHVPSRLTISALAYQSEDVDFDALAEPENRNPLAYAILKGDDANKPTVFPWTLPFDLPLEEVRLYLERAGLSRRQLIHLMAPTSDNEAVFVREVLGLGEWEAHIISAEPVVPPKKLPDVYECWGITATTNRIYDAASGKFIPLDNKPNATALQLLQNVSILLQQSRMSFEELLAVLKTQFVNSSEAATQLDNNENCKPSDINLPALKIEHLDRIHQFVRLQRRLGWTTEELDAAISATKQGAGKIALSELANLVQLHELLDLPITVISKWWTAPESEVTRQRQLAKALGIIVAKIEHAKQLLGIKDEFTSTTQLLDFCQDVKNLQRSGLSFEDLRYLLQHDVDEPTTSNASLSDTEQKRLVKAVREALAATDANVQELPFPGSIDDKKGEIQSEIDAELAKFPLKLDDLELLSASILTKYLPVPSNARDVNASERQQLAGWIDAKIALHLAQKRAVTVVIATHLGAERELVEYFLTVALNSGTKKAIGVFLEQDFRAEKEPNLIAANSALIRLYKAVVICGALNLGLVDLYLLIGHDRDERAFTTLDFNKLPVVSTNPTTILVDFEKLLALAQLRNLSLGASELLRQYAMLNFAEAETVDVTKSASVYALLGVGLGLSKEQVKQAADRLSITEPEHFRDPIKLTYLLELLIALRHLGASVDDVRGPKKDDPKPTPSEPYGLIAPSPNQPDAHAAKELLREKYSDSERRSIIKPISDALRERQRDMLVDYLVHKKQLRNASDLYEYYLIDVELASCFKTTRLLMATAAVQLYIQRVMLNLEKGVSLKSDKRKQWEWIQSYRVWEANRKVFLFPENWLLPELRDDKTETFRQMESVLTQGEPTPEVTRNALLTYLDDLGEVAQIQVIAMYEEDGTLYVLGSAPNTPYRYFLRFRTGDMWTGWEALDLDNANDFVMPFVFEGDLHIAWPTFKKTSVGAEIADLRWEVQIAWVRRTTQGWTKRKLCQDTLTTQRLLAISDLRSFVFQVRKRTDPIPMAKELQQETIIIDCFVASEGQNIPVFKPDLSKNNSAFQHNLDNAWNWEKSYLNVSGQVAERYSIEGCNVWRPRTDAMIILNTRMPDSRPGSKTVYGDGEGKFSFDQYYIEDKHAYYGPIRGLEIRNASKFKLSIFKRNPTKELYSVPGEARGAEGVQYTLWTWNYTLVVEIPIPVDTPYKPDRELSFSETTANFELRSGADMELKMLPSGPQLDRPPHFDVRKQVEIEIVQIDEEIERIDSLSSTFELQQQRGRLSSRKEELKILSKMDNYDQVHMQRLGNQYVLGRNRLPSVVEIKQIQISNQLFLTIDRKFGSQLVVTPCTFPTNPGTLARVCHFQDDIGRFYILNLDQQKPKLYSLPDNQEFVGAYRTIASVSVPMLLDGTIQKQSREEQFPVPASSSNGLTTIFNSLPFERHIPYANYNWELFLHAPLAIAAHLASQQRFEDARQWLHAVFDPTTEDVEENKPQFWRFLPFSNQTQPDAIAALLTLLAKPLDPTLSDDERKEIEDKTTELGHQIAEWKKNPFMPHVIARLRPSAYQWYTVFAYLDVLIGWADYLFRRDTRESVNEATLLYVLAAKLLGPRPRTIPARSKTQENTYRELQAQKNGNEDFWDPWINYAELDGFKPLIAEPDDISKIFQDIRRGKYKPTKANLVDAMPEHTVVTSLGRLAFCIPQNEKVTEYHNTLEDRLFKVRHCQNIDGEFRDLPLYDPPIDPLLLIRARAAGLDLRTVLEDISTPLPHYRFSFTLQKALELCTELKSLGGALLSTLEKQDAEELALLRSSHEVAMLKLVQEIRERQVAEAEANIVALEQSELTIRERFAQYQKLLGNTGVTKGDDGIPVMEQSSSLTVAQGATGDMSGLGLIQEEVNQANWLTVANTYTQVANGVHILASALHLIPNFTIKAFAVDQQYGGSNFGSAASAIAKAVEMGAVNANYFAGRANLIAGYQRRRDEWVHQSKLALSELKQIKKQLLAAQIRKEIAEHELSNHDQQIKNAQQIEDFMRSKFTNQQLYRWMSNQISQLYFRTYQLAFDQAKRAERAYQHELGLETKPSFVRTGQWDNLKRGLLAGDQLHHDLKRMEGAYLANNKREFEITKHVSLLQLDPSALVNLRETNKCTFELPEVLFDLDFPDHYLRRIKSVSLSIPCVTGPYASVSATLRLVASSTRYSSSKDPKDLLKLYGPITSIVTSSGQMDSGMFETNLRDERYLPFEGAGAVSEWELSLPADFKQFDYRTISDVVLHIRYTAQGGNNNGNRSSEIKEQLNVIKSESKTQGLGRLFSLRNEFPTQWAQLLSASSPKVEFEILPIHFSFFLKSATIAIKKVELTWLLRTKRESVLPVTISAGIGTVSSETPPPSAVTEDKAEKSSQYFEASFEPPISFNLTGESARLPMTIQFNADNTETAKKNDLHDLLVILHYELANP